MEAPSGMGGLGGGFFRSVTTNGSSASWSNPCATMGCAAAGRQAAGSRQRQAAAAAPAPDCCGPPVALYGQLLIQCTLVLCHSAACEQQRLRRALPAATGPQLALQHTPAGIMGSCHSYSRHRMIEGWPGGRQAAMITSSGVRCFLPWPC